MDRSTRGPDEPTGRFAARSVAWALGAVAAFAVVAAFASQEAPRFVLFCGQPIGNTPADFADGDPDGWSPCICGGDQRLGDPGFGDAALALIPPRLRGNALTPSNLAPPDDAPCIPDTRRVSMEFWAEDAWTKLGALGFRDPVGDVPRLGPTVLDPGTGDLRVRIFADPMFAAYAETYNACDTTWVHIDRHTQVRMSIETFGVPAPGRQTSFPDEIAHRMLTHELVHVIQNGQRFYRSAAECPPPLWIMESTADVLSVWLMEREFGRFHPSLRFKGSRSVYGLRPYNLAFTLADRTRPDQWDNKLVPDYTLSSFWRYLAERYFDGGYGYLAELFAISPGEVGTDWLKWLDVGLRSQTGYGLYTLFPDFVGNFATWGPDRYGIDQETWLREGFAAGMDGCHEVHLTPGERVRNLELDLQPISAQCVVVSVEGLSPEQASRVRFTAYDADSTRLDDLHLTLATSSTPPVEGGEARRCAALRASGPLCEVEGLPGRPSGPALRRGAYAKIWAGEAYRESNGEMENLYLVSHAPLRPADARHDVFALAGTTDHGGGQGTIPVVALPTRRVDLSIALENADMVAMDTSADPPRRVNGPETRSEVNGVPEGDRAPSSGAEASPAGALIGMRERLGPLPAAAPGGGGSVGDGVWSLKLTDAELGEAYGSGFEIDLLVADRPLLMDGLDSVRALVSGTTGGRAQQSDDEMIAGLLDAIRSGDEQQARAATSGVLGNQILNVPVDDTEGSAVIRVVEFSEDLLHLRIRGRYCRGSDYDADAMTCRDVRTFSAELSRAPGWLYSGQNAFEGIATPGLEEFRRVRPSPVAGLMPSVDELIEGARRGEDPSSAPPPVAAEVPAEYTCSCSCDEYRRIQEILAKVMTPGRTAPPAGDTLSMMRCPSLCAVQYAQCGRVR